MIVLNVLVVLICATGIHGAEKVYCDCEDVECTTKSARAVYYYEIEGQKGKWNSSDPLKPNQVQGSTCDVSIKSNNAELTGLKQCDVVYLKMNTTANTMEYDVVCPRITSVGTYQVKGNIGDEYVDGEGHCKVIHDDYKFIINTNYEDYTKDEKTYIRITDFEFIFEINGLVNYHCDTELFDGDKQKADKVLGYMNENWETMEKAIGNQLMTCHMSKYIDNMNDELKWYPIKEFFYYEV